MDNECRVVLYTDGAAKPSRGNWGSGYFGYIYNIDSVESYTKGLQKSINPTTHGFTCPELYQEDPNFYKHAKTVQITDYIIGSIPGREINTNNYAEAYSLYKALVKVKEIEKNIKHILIFMDSQMLIYVAQELINNPSPNLSKYAFPELYKSVHDVMVELQKKDVKIVVKHTYGHSFSFGNNIADRLAFMGRLACEEYILTGEDKNLYNFEEVIPSNPEKDNFWSKIDLSSYLYGRNLYVTSDHQRGVTPYYVLDYSKDVEVGEKDGETLMGSIYTTKGDDVVENIINKHFTINPDDGIVVNVELNNVKHFLTVFFNRVNDRYCFTKENKQNNLTVVEEYTVCRTLRPGCLANNLLNKFYFHNEIIRQVELEINNHKDQRDKFIEIFDITDKIYKKVEKKNKVGYECLLTMKDLVIVLNYKDKDFPFSLGVDLPNRNYLKKFENSKDVKVFVCYNKISEQAYEYFFFIKSEQEEETLTSVWGNFYSNKIYL